jgi:hypothetical protein
MVSKQCPHVKKKFPKSNISLIDPKTKETTRVELDEGDKKVRFSKKSKYYSNGVYT